MKPVYSIVLVAAVSGVVACVGQPEVAEEAEAPALAVTNWTDRTELFAEYPPLVQGEHAVFAVHLTDLRDFSALTTGTARVELTPQGGGQVAVLEGGASRPGVFRSEGTVPAAGTYQMALVVTAPGIDDRHDLGTVRVFAEQAAAWADAEAQPGDDAAAITYLKEQQWVNPFATAPATETDLQQVIRVPATIGPITGGEAIISTPAAGRFMTDRLLSIGDRVTRGQVVGRLEPRLAEGGADRVSLAAAVAEAQVAVDGARVELARAERLLEERAVPARRVEDARRALTVAEARLKAAEARLAQRDEALATGGGTAAGNAFVLRAPIAGRAVEVFAALGASYDEGAPLFRVVRTDEIELRVLVPAAEAHLITAVHTIALETPGRPEPLALEVEHMHDSGALDERTRALSVQFHVDNSDGRLLLGQTGTALVPAGGMRRALGVPQEAVLTEGGRPYVFVQAGGESFVRRFVETGVRDGGLVEVRSGLRPGDRVVTRGAYDVQLAAASNALPAEGHVH